MVECVLYEWSIKRHSVKITTYCICIPLDYLTNVPGIASSSVSQDDCGQRYHSTAQKTFADVWVIGRAIVGTSREADRGTTDSENNEDCGVSGCVERLNALM